MKKIVLLLSTVVISNIVSAQFFYLSGTSYTQTFDKISTGTPSVPSLPVEWTVYTGATATALGASKTLQSSSKGTQYPWRNVGGGFKDVASADNFTASTDSATQTNATDRALAVRQVSTTNTNFPDSDPGAAFVFRVANTKNLSQFHFSFKLQSLDDTSHRKTDWIFEYALGNNPTTFTAITTTPASLSTGGDVFSNVTVTGIIPTAIDNSNIPVYLRLRSASAASPVPPNTGGNRATTAIDDFNLTWTGNAVGVQDVKAENALELSAIGMPVSNKIVLSCAFAKAGKYNVSIYDLTGKNVYKNTAVYHSGKQVISIEDINLQAGMYIVNVSDNVTTGVVKVNIQ